MLFLYMLIPCSDCKIYKFNQDNLGYSLGVTSKYLLIPSRKYLKRFWFYYAQRNRQCISPQLGQDFMLLFLGFKEHGESHN